jgi:hypothetical protein
MNSPKKMPPFSYFVSLSQKDQEFVATFLELPSLSGLAPTVHGAIAELNLALEAWSASVSEEELPPALFSFPFVIIDRSFLAGGEVSSEQLLFVLPEELQPEENREPGNTSNTVASTPTRTIRVSKDNRDIRI